MTIFPTKGSEQMSNCWGLSTNQIVICSECLLFVVFFFYGEELRDSDSVSCGLLRMRPGSYYGGGQQSYLGLIGF